MRLTSEWVKALAGALTLLALGAGRARLRRLSERCTVLSTGHLEA